RQLHAPGRLLILPNAWDASSARLVAACGAEAVATTSAGLSWSRGYPDGNALPLAILRQAVREIARAIAIPLTVDIEAGYSDDPGAVGALVAALIDCGAVGVNLEDGSDLPDVLGAKIAAGKGAAARAGVDLFVNARTDVYLRRQVPPERAAAETLARGMRYRQAGSDGLFAPGLSAPAEIRAIAAAIDDMPLNVMAMAGLPAAAQLRQLGARRLSAGAALAAAAFARVRRLA